MRIIIDARESGTSTGRYVDKLIEYLHDLKPSHEIIVLSKSPRSQYFKEVAPNFRFVDSNYKEFTFSEQFGLMRQIRRLNPDLVHFTMTQQPAFYRNKKITTIHDLTTARFNNPDKNLVIYKFKQQIYRWLIRSVARSSWRIITISNYVKGDIVGFTHIDPAKIEVTYEAADKFNKPAEPIANLADKQFIMYVGRPTPHKNLERLVDAFAILKQTHPYLVLVLAGKLDNNYAQIKKSVERKGISDVVFTDFVNEGVLRWLYENTAAYVFPSLSEGFGLPSLEAMAHDAPVVSSNATCLPEINGDAAHYFDPRDVNDIAHKINDVLSDPALRAGLIKNGKIQVGKYSWAEMAKKTLGIYNQAS